MTIDELTNKLDKIWADFDCALSDESIMTVGKVLNKLRDEFGDFIEEIKESGIKE